MNENIPLAFTYRLTAIDFWMSAKILHENFESKNEILPGNIRAVPFYYLISHACELLLKCALLKRGISPLDLRKPIFGHDLSKLLKELENKGVQVTPESKMIINRLNAQHSRHALRYTALLDDGHFTFTPEPSHVFQTLDELLMTTRVCEEIDI